jgi:hypothetical protein
MASVAMEKYKFIFIKAHPGSGKATQGGSSSVFTICPKASSEHVDNYTWLYS